MSDQELKPCPFCGGEAWLDASGDSNFSMIYDGYASVRCNDCDIETPWFETKNLRSLDECNADSDRVIREATDFWNTRPPMQDCAEEMYSMLEFLVDNDSINDHSIDKEVQALLTKARGEN